MYCSFLPRIIANNWVFFLSHFNLRGFHNTIMGHCGFVSKGNGPTCKTPHNRQSPVVSSGVMPPFFFFFLLFFWLRLSMRNRIHRNFRSSRNITLCSHMHLKVDVAIIWYSLPFIQGALSYLPKGHAECCLKLPCQYDSNIERCFVVDPFVV